MFPVLPNWGDPVGLAFLFVGLGVLLWGLSKLVKASK